MQNIPTPIEIFRKNLDILIKESKKWQTFRMIYLVFLGPLLSGSMVWKIATGTDKLVGYFFLSVLENIGDKSLTINVNS